MERARERWTLAYVGGNALRHRRQVPQPYNRHTQGTHWYVRGGCTNEARDTLAHSTDMLALVTDTLALTRSRMDSPTLAHELCVAGFAFCRLSDPQRSESARSTL